MSEDIVKRRMDSAMDQALDKAKEVEREEGISLPPQIVGQMAIAMFDARMRLLFSNSGDLPEDPGRLYQ